jgi:ankyrin repeat protein
MSSEIPHNLSLDSREWLVKQGYNPQDLNLHGENGDTALMKATKAGLFAVVEELIDVGADVNAINNDGNNALWFACFGNHYDLINLLLAAHIDINNQNDNGATVLMYAASSGKAGVLQLLLQHQPELNLKNLDDFQAIDFASNIEVFKILKNATKAGNRQKSSRSD